MDKIYLDTSGLKALLDINDDFHEQAVEIWKKLQQEGVQLILSNYILNETLTLLRIRCNLETTLKVRQLVLESSSAVRLIRITSEDEQDAWEWFEQDLSGLSYTDCVSFAAMRRLGIARCLSFDRHFERAGFELEK